MNKTYVLFISCFCSDEKYEWLRSIRTKPSLDPAQKTFKAVCSGLTELGCDVTCISALPIGTSNSEMDYYPRSEEVVSNIRFIYPEFRIGKLKKMFDLYRNVKPEIDAWLMATKGKERVLICDSLVAMCTFHARLLAQKNGVKAIAYVTDYPSMATSIKKRDSFHQRLLQQVFDRFADNDLKRYDGYILVADKLKELIGIGKKPYIVIEDLITAPGDFIPPTNDGKETFDILYGGALCERFGINRLVDAMKHIESKKTRMLFYGSGESIEYIQKAALEDSRICYCGNVEFYELQKIQKTVNLLINPRPTDEVFVAYSFPSKTLSYMLSGVPVLTTKIPSIPASYEPYLYWFDQEDALSMANTITKITNYPKSELAEKGKRAFEYAITEKNSLKQSQRILDFARAVINV